MDNQDCCTETKKEEIEEKDEAACSCGCCSSEIFTNS